MTTILPSFDAETPDTPEGMAPAIAAADVGGIPSVGSGLRGAVYVPGTAINSLADFQAILDSGADPDLTFTATEIAYGAKSSNTTVAEFLDHDAGSLSGDGTAFEMGPSGITLSGYVYIPPGAHVISVFSDDGFNLSLGGVDFSAADGITNGQASSRLAEFDGGLYAVELTYYDAKNAMSLAFAIDGLPFDQSAFYQAPEDFTDPPADVPLVPVDDYHPSYFLGEDSLDTPIDGEGSEGRDIITGKGADDTINGYGGDDELRGGYGDDELRGGDGNDVIDGGRGSNLLDGGAGDDLLIVRAGAGEQRIGQLAIGEPTRDDPDGEVDEDRQKLSAYLDQPLVAENVLIGGEGRDTFLVNPLINGKADIIAKHVRQDGTINWQGVAGENDELHDHWGDSFGIAVIADYNALEDSIAVIGHTANVYVEHANVMGDEALESIITVISQQHGGGGAHTQDLMGQIIVHGDLVEADDIQTDAGVFYGIVEGIDDLAEALMPQGELKVTEIDGETVYGYDTRDDQGNLGAIPGNPADHFNNPFFDDSMLVTPVHGDEVELTRDAFDPLGFTPVSGEDNTQDGAAKAATSGDDEIAPDAPAEPEGLPGALAFWSLASGADGVYDDARGGPEVRAYTLHENQTLLRTDGATTGPDGTAGSALIFDGEDDFAYVNHDDAFEVSQGTIALWVRPDNLDGGKEIFLSKDAFNTGDGGHFRLGHGEDGRLFLRTAPGDGGANTSWISNDAVFSEGNWSHVAVSYTADGVIVYVDGVPIGADAWTAVEGDVAAPNDFTGYFMLQNEEPWVLGADTSKTKRNDSAQEFGIDDEDLGSPFEGALAQVGIWGGMDASDALTEAEINQLIAEGPGAALTNPSGPEPMEAGDDMFEGGAGNDTIEGGAGDDMLFGDEDDDVLLGGYGDDKLEGGDGNDILNGGRGSDLLIGGDGDDTLIVRSEGGEQRIGQLVLDDPSRDFPDPSVDNAYLKLVDWVDQPLVADDVLIGGGGNDHFQIEGLINGKKDILIDNLMEDGRSIHWHGVAGENNRLHDHWVDLFGIVVIADYVAGEDTISIIGHTVNIEVTHLPIDMDEDGFNDNIMSVITAYSQQGNGGAHDEDIVGYVVVFGDLVEEEDVITDAGVHYGIVDTIDELQEALAPSGETKTSVGPNGEELFGYDSRDVDGDPIGTNPFAYSDNPWLGTEAVDLASALPDGVDPPAIALSDAGGVFDGSETGVKKIEHSAPLAQVAGTIAFSFVANDPAGASWQGLLSKDHTGLKTGGHMTIYLSPSGQVKVRFQGETETVYLYGDRVEAGQDVHIAFTFDEDQIKLYQDGALVDEADGFPNSETPGFPGGMSGNTEDIYLGASAEQLNGADANLRYFFEGKIGDLAILDRPLDDYEALFLAAGGGDLEALAAIYPPDGLPSVEDPTDPGPNLLEGDDEDNTLKGYDDADLILGYAGNDKMYGYGDDDEIDGGEGNDRGYGGDGNDTMRGDEGDDRLNGDAGEDDIDGGAGEDRLRGGDDDDTLSGGTENDKLFGDGGNDDLDGDEGDDLLKGGDGDDDLDGGAGNDRLRGGDGADTMAGGADDDDLRGGEGDDDLDGGDGNDNLRGDGGNDTMDGGEGDDTLRGGSGDDDMDGGDGNDTLRGDADNDTIDGGEGDDTLRGGAGDDDIDGGDDNDSLRGDAGNDTLDGGEGDDDLRGGEGNDVLEGGEGNDNIRANAGNDEAYGGAGDDTIRANSGSNIIAGGTGNDLLIAGSDDDTFVFEDFGADNADRLRKFESGVDTIALNAAAFSVGAFDADLFEFAAAATSADTRFLYDARTGDLSYDADGNGAGAAELIAELDNRKVLTIDDFDFV